MKDDLSDLVIKLRDRNIQLGQSITTEDWKTIYREIPLLFGDVFRSIYSKFDGFLNADYRSQITLWPLSEIVKGRSNGIGGKLDNEKWVLIGDFLIESDYIIYEIGGNHHSVKMLGDEKEISSDIGDFLNYLVRGDFDFMK